MAGETLLHTCFVSVFAWSTHILSFSCLHTPLLSFAHVTFPCVILLHTLFMSPLEYPYATPFSRYARGRRAAIDLERKVEQISSDRSIISISFLAPLRTAFSTVDSIMIDGYRSETKVSSGADPVLIGDRQSFHSIDNRKSGCVFSSISTASFITFRRQNGQLSIQVPAPKADKAEGTGRSNPPHRSSNESIRF